MKIIIFTDIHGHYETLKALMLTKDFLESDLRINLGDSIDVDMDNNESLSLLDYTKTYNVFGNYEAMVFDWFKDPSKNPIKYNAKKLQLKKSLNSKSMDILNNFTRTLEIKLGNKKFLFNHYKWETPNNLIFRDEPSFEYTKSIYKDDDFDFIIYGHDHNFYCYTDKDKMMMSIGSVGYKCPSPYIIIDAQESQEAFLQNNPHLKNYVMKALKHNYKSILENTSCETKSLYENDKIHLQLGLMNYDDKLVKAHYINPKMPTRNFKLKMTIIK